MFRGHLLRRHSNPTKINKVWWPRQTKLLVGFGLRFLRFFFFLMGFDEFLQVFDGVSTGCGEASSKTRFCWLKPVIAQNQVLIPRPVFFRDLVDVGYKYKYKYIIFKFYIEFSCFGGKCCGGILTLQKIKAWWPRHNR